MPFGITLLDARYGDRTTPASYLPALEGPRARTPFASFVSFFPHLVAGPIMRAGTLLTQVERPRRFDVSAA